MLVQDVINTMWGMRDKLFRFSLKILDSKSEAEDVVQEVYYKVLNQSGGLENLVNPEAWCMTLTKNLSLDKLKSKHRRVEDISIAVAIKEYSNSPAEQTELNDAVSQIKKLMRELPEKQRLVFHLRDVEQLHYEEIAEVLKIPLAQVKVSLSRARLAIRTKLIELDTFKSE